MSNSNSVFRTYKYRIYPSQKQEEILNNILDVGCWLYNRALNYRRKMWKESRLNVSFFDQSTMWKEWRNEDPDNNPLRILNMSAGQRVLRRLDSAFHNFFQGKRGYPRYKNKKRFNSIDYTFGDGSQIKGKKLYIQNTGLISVKWHRDFPEESKIKSCTILRKPSGWYVLFRIEIPEFIPESHNGSSIGIDMGITHALTLSNGDTFDSPKYLKQSLKKLRVLNRRVSRRRKGSNRWKKSVKQLAKHHEHIANQRKDWWHKVTRQLVNKYSIIIIEDLSLGFMLKNKILSRSAYDVSLGMFREMLDYKAMEAGVKIITVNPAYTSQTCSGCGQIVPKDLNIRIHNCSNCGLVIDRDVNAARNILQAGMQPSSDNVAGCSERGSRRISTKEKIHYTTNSKEI